MANLSSEDLDWRVPFQSLRDRFRVAANEYPTLQHMVVKLDRRFQEIEAAQVAAAVTAMKMMMDQQHRLGEEIRGPCLLTSGFDELEQYFLWGPRQAIDCFERLAEYAGNLLPKEMLQELEPISAFVAPPHGRGPGTPSWIAFVFGQLRRHPSPLIQQSDGQGGLWDGLPSTSISINLFEASAVAIELEMAKPIKSGRHQPKPRWDKKTRKLWYGEILCASYTRVAPDQMKVLDVFEEEGWTERIDDPLNSGKFKQTLDNLSDKLRDSPLSITADGTGTGFIWRNR